MRTVIGALMDVPRAAPRIGAAEIRTIAAGAVETWSPTCWVKGELVLESNRWLTRWHEGRWEFTHKVNVKSVSSP